MPITSSLAGVARVAFEAQTGEFNADVSRAERVYRDATGGMSDGAIKLELAQERLRRSLAKGPTAAREQARALLSVRQAERELQTQSDRTTREIDQQQRSLGRLSRGALAGSGIFRGLGRSIAFASAGFLGGAGLVYGLRKALEVGSNLNEQTTKTEAVFGSASKSVLAFANDALGQAKDQALETASSIGALLRPLGVAQNDAARISVTLTKLGTDLSSFYNTDVSDALTAIRSGLVGQSEPLQKYGVQLNEARVQAVALAQSGKDNAKELTNQEKAYARVAIILRDTKIAQGDYADTIGGAANQEREFQKNLRNTEAIIGGALQPAYRGLLRDVNDWLGSAENQKRLQRDVNEAVQTGTGIVKGLATGFRIANSFVRPFVDGIGGAKNATLALTAAWVAWKAKSVLAFAATAASSALTSRKMIADAEAAGAAWDIATRPRGLIVTGGGGTLGRAGGVLGTAAALIGASFIYNRGKRQEALARWNALTGNEQRRIVGNDPKAMAALEALGYTFKPIVVKPGGGAAASPDSSIRGGGRVTAPRSSGGTGTTVPTPRTLLDIQIELARAQAAGDTAGQVRALREERGRFQAQIRFLEHRKNLTDKQKQQLQGLYGQLQSAQAALDQIAESKEAALDKQKQDAAARREKILTARRTKEEAAAKQLQAETDRINAFAQKNVDRLNKALRQAKSGPQLIRDARSAATASSADKPLSRAEFQALLGDALTAQATITAKYAPNFQTHVLEHLMRENNAHLSQLTQSARFTHTPVIRRIDEAAMQT